MQSAADCPQPFWRMKAHSITIIPDFPAEIGTTSPRLPTAGTPRLNSATTTGRNSCCGVVNRNPVQDDSYRVASYHGPIRNIFRDDSAGFDQQSFRKRIIPEEEYVAL